MDQTGPKQDYMKKKEIAQEIPSHFDRGSESPAFSQGSNAQ
jgi:hypothetical protein